MGFESYNRRTLTCPPEFDIVPYRLITDGRVQSYRLRLQDKNETVLLDGLKDYRLASNATKDAKDLREQILKGKLDLSTPEKGYSRVYVNDRENNRALQSEMLPEREADELKQRILQLAFPEECNIEGFHIVEHILLRPGDDDFSLMTPISVPDMLAIKYNQVPANLPQIPEESIVIADPYSFWITVIAPSWLPQFRQNKNAQHRFEQLVRREAPAHIAVKFCWLPAQEMYAFETRYLKWLYENALPEPNERELTEHANNLLEELGKCSYTIRPIDNPCSSENVGETKDSIHNT